MSSEVICKTVRQYNKTPISEEDMQKLVEIAKDYNRVKNYVYQRYSGIRSLPKLYPGYTIQNEMTKSGLRAELGLPSVYFYLAVFDALGDIKNQWAQVRNRISKCIRENQSLTAQDRHYLRFVIKQSECFENILLGKRQILSENWEKPYWEACMDVDTERLDKYLCRLVRRYLNKELHTDVANGFSVSERAYRYGDHGIYIAVKEKRKRIFIPLTDHNGYKKQLYIRLFPEEGNIIIHVPVEVQVKSKEGYDNRTGLAVGLFTMFVTDQGHIYGEKYGEYQFALADHIKEGNARYRKNRNSNPGRKKYNAQKARLEAALHTYVNAEINRLLETEKPAMLFVPKLPRNSKAGINKSINYSVGMWQRGYVRKRLELKCKEQAIELVEVLGKDISRQCSGCGEIGVKVKDLFLCDSCGLQMPERENAAKNALKRGIALQEK
jgi:putative transposase